MGLIVNNRRKMGLLDFFRRDTSDSTSTRRTYSSSAYNDRAVSVYTDNMAIRISTVYSAVDLISSTVAKLPCRYMRYNRAKRIYVDYRDAALYWALLREPNERMTAFMFWKNVVSQMLLQGNAYCLVERTGDKVRLVLLAPGTVTHQINLVPEHYVVNDIVNGVQGTFLPADILHFRNISLNGGHDGVSTIAAGAETLGIQATGDRETLNRFAQGGKFKALYCNDDSVQGFGDYADSALDEGAEDIQEKLNSGMDIISVPGSGKIQPLSMSSVDLQYLENRKFGVREICRFFRVPPTKVYDDFSGAYKSTSEANVEFLTDSIDPILCNIEQELEKKLFFGAYGSYKIQFDRRKLFTTDLTTKAAYQKSTIENGLMSVNDWRRVEDLEPVEGGDQVYMSVNLTPLGQPKSEDGAE